MQQACLSNTEDKMIFNRRNGTLDGIQSYIKHTSLPLHCLSPSNSSRYLMNIPCISKQNIFLLKIKMGTASSRMFCGHQREGDVEPLCNTYLRNSSSHSRSPRSQRFTKPFIILIKHSWDHRCSDWRLRVRWGSWALPKGGSILLSVDQLFENGQWSFQHVVQSVFYLDHQFLAFPLPFAWFTCVSVSSYTTGLSSFLALLLGSPSFQHSAPICLFLLSLWRWFLDRTS